jgi:Dolichyl-phosphate-mannose-protein mannosyltransferase
MDAGNLIDRPSKADWGLCLAAVVIGVVGKALVGWYAPLWLDETYSGVIASQPDFAHWFDWVLHELSGPSYYGLLWLWAKIAGTSDFALRLPSFLLSVAVLPMIWFGSDSERRVRLFWMALAALWLPGLYYAAQARPQSLLLLLATAQAVLFVRGYRNPDLRKFALWSAMTAVMLATHVYTALPGGLQGLALLWRSRGQWQKLWPAALIFMPALAWLLLQVPFMLEFAKPENSWYPLKHFGELAELGWQLAAFPALAEFSLLLVGLAFFRPEVRKAIRPSQTREICGEVIVASIGIAAIFMMFAVGTIRPSFDVRYLMPCMPAVFLGAAYILAHAQNWGRLLAPVTVTLFILVQVTVVTVHSKRENQRTLYPLQFQSASDWLIGKDSQRILFAWDNQAAAINSDQKLAEVGNFFFARASHDATMIVVRKAGGRSWSENLLEASRRNNADIVWLGGTDYPAELLHQPELDCHRWNDKQSSQSMACRRLVTPRS